MRLVLLEQLSIRLPSFGERYADALDRHAVAEAIRADLPGWQEIPRGAERPGDVVLLRLRGAPMHVGVVVRPGSMLHVEDGIAAVIERYDDGRWSRRVAGIYRAAAG